MKRVITYGTFDLLHRGHIRLLERAKQLGDYLIVGVTAEDYDKARGKINVQQSLMERIEGVRATGLADDIIVEEYEGQKIDDIKRYQIDIFTVGSDWVGKFDYLNEYCHVVYLERTKDISSSDLRTAARKVRFGVCGDTGVVAKFIHECSYVNGLELVGIATHNSELQKIANEKRCSIVTDEFEVLLGAVDALYLATNPEHHYEQIQKALLQKKHIICEAPITLTQKETRELFKLAKEQGCILMDAIKTAYAMAYSRLLLLVKTGNIGNVVSIDAVCTSLADIYKNSHKQSIQMWNSICAWGPTALLPIFQLLGTQYKKKRIISHLAPEMPRFDLFTKIDFIYENAVATIKVGKGIKSEGQLIISGTNGYIYVPAPWWKTDYFEIRYENQTDNRQYFYQLDGEGIRYMLVAFCRSIQSGKSLSNLNEGISIEISAIMEAFYTGTNMDII